MYSDEKDVPICWGFSLSLTKLNMVHVNYVSLISDFDWS